MGQIERYTNLPFRLRREWTAYITTPDGVINIGRTMNASARMSSQQEFVTEIHNDIEEQVDSITNSSSMSLSFGFTEILTPQVQNYFFGDGVAPVITTRQSLKRWAESLVWPVDDENGNQKESQLVVPFGVPQTHDSTRFPPATAPNLTATGSGDIASGTGYAWVVPLYLDMDEFHGYSSLSLSDFTTMARAREFVFGTPSASDNVSFSGSEGGQLDWTVPSYGSDVAIPTHWVVVLGTTNVITAATSKITAVVPFGTTTATFSSIGTVQFGTAPALGDLNAVETIASGSPLVYTRRVQDTDYTFDPASGIFKRIAGSSNIKPATPCRKIAWRQAASQVEQKYQSPNGIDREVGLRLICAYTRTGNAVARRAILGQLDIPRVRIKGTDSDLLSSNPGGWHNALNKNCTALYDPSKGYIAKFTSEHEDFENVIDFFSSEVTPAAA